MFFHLQPIILAWPPPLPLFGLCLYWGQLGTSWWRCSSKQRPVDHHHPLRVSVILSSAPDPLRSRPVYQMPLSDTNMADQQSHPPYVYILSYLSSPCPSSSLSLSPSSSFPRVIQVLLKIFSYPLFSLCEVTIYDAIYKTEFKIYLYVYICVYVYTHICTHEPVICYNYFLFSLFSNFTPVTPTFVLLCFA